MSFSPRSYYDDEVCTECRDPDCEGPTSGLCRLDECGVCGESVENCEHTDAERRVT